MTPVFLATMLIATAAISFYLGYSTGKHGQTQGDLIDALQQQIIKLDAELILAQSTNTLMRKQMETEDMIRAKKSEATRKPEDLRA